MKNTFILLPIICLQIIPVFISAQEKVNDDMYIDYQQYFNDALKRLSDNKEVNTPSAKQLQDSSAVLMDEIAAAVSIKKGSSKSLDPEHIFSKRKNSVFIIGKLKRKDDQGRVNFDLTGTAFAIDENGICVTNYHVLKDILTKDDSAVLKDSVYFIMTFNRKVYFIQQVLAYSQNNDIAIFKVNTIGDKLIPIPFAKAAPVGAPVYCLSHPGAHFYYFTNGMVSRNIVTDSANAAAGYNSKGRSPIRMEITADYGIGSSGGPILDKYANLIGIVSSTAPIGSFEIAGHQQLVVKDAIPVRALMAIIQ